MSDAPTTAPADTLDAHFPRLVAGMRTASAAVLAGLVGGAFWLTIMQEGHAGRIFDHTWTEHDFPDGLGNAFGAEEPAKLGLVLSLILAIAMAAIFMLAERRLPGRGWVKGLSFSPVIFLLWGAVFCPLVDSRQVLQGEDFVYLPTGWFASECGSATLLSAAAASIVTGIVFARVSQLVRTTEWWRENDRVRRLGVVDPGGGDILDVSLPPDPALADTSSDGRSLELPEQRGEQRGERPG